LFVTHSNIADSFASSIIHLKNGEIQV
jgi:hypothetical protein